MEAIVFKGKKLEDAIKNAENDGFDLNSSYIYKVIQEAKSGFLGFGSKECIIEISKINKEKNIKDEAIEIENEVAIDESKISSKTIIEVEKFIIELTLKMGDKRDVDINVNNGNIEVMIKGENNNIFIGKNGEILDSIQYLATRVASKYNKGYVKVKLDAGDYRIKRKKEINNIAKNAANKSWENRMDVKMKSMNAYERRIVHAALQNDGRVKTNSIGSEPYRYVVVSPVK